MTKTKVIVSAASGFFLVVYDRKYVANDAYVTGSRQPVIAWSIDPDGGPFSATPITVNGAPPAHIHWAVLYVDAL
jgi:hypothetical protein